LQNKFDDTKQSGKRIALRNWAGPLRESTGRDSAMSRLKIGKVARVSSGLTDMDQNLKVYCVLYALE
jgi:hypothetical protein